MAGSVSRLSRVVLALGLTAFALHAAHAQRALNPSQVQAPNPNPSDLHQPVRLDSELKRQIAALVSNHPSFSGFQVEVTVENPNRPVPACSGARELKLNESRRPWGTAGVTLSCSTPSWSFNIPVKTRVFGSAVRLARNVAAGAKLSAQDLELFQGEVTKLPAGFIRDLESAQNRVVNRAMSAGNLLTLNNFRVSAVVRPKEVVRVTVLGRGFQATGEAIAQTPGGVGDLIQVRMTDGQIVAAEVVGPGSVRVRLD